MGTRIDGGSDCVSRYDSFEKMLDVEGPENVNPPSPREVQLAEAVDLRRSGR